MVHIVVHTIVVHIDCSGKVQRLALRLVTDPRHHPYEDRRVDIFCSRCNPGLALQVTTVRFLRRLTLFYGSEIIIFQQMISSPYKG